VWHAPCKGLRVANVLRGGSTMNYGFVIDNSSCIGCHACSTACKSENDVPLGVYRTWVKQTEVGAYPDARRSFQVTRCNHCANPPCVRICPTGAMYQRADGIVEFDSDACIGCKGCTQACPYDAIHIDPESHTAAKCHFCSHRVEVGLEPACVVVCPEHAIIAGDLDDPASEIRQVLARNDVTVRKPEQGTAPKLFYIDGHAPSLIPTAARRTTETGVWSDIVQHHEPLSIAEQAAAAQQEVRANLRGTATRTPDVQGLPHGGPLQVGGPVAAQLMQVTYAPQHAVQWHWEIPAYLVTKHIAGGIFLFLAVTALTSWAPFNLGVMIGGGALAILMTLVTLGLLLHDLERPDRFFFLLVRPQWRSWIARAAWILSGFSALSGAWWAVELVAALGWIDPSWAISLRAPLAVLTAPFALMVAIYTAFLFAQCEGRDLWQGTHLPVAMTAQALYLGGGAVASLGVVVTQPPEVTALALSWFVGGLVLNLAVTVWADLAVAAPSEIARAGLREMTQGRYREHFRRGLLIGQVLPLALLATGVSLLVPVAFLAAAGGLFSYQYAFVMAAQRIPNS
jgi:Fe-S-cluster-containing dehydrogenase component/formate-dependent nitrite reductase membrane component NrfD